MAVVGVLPIGVSTSATILIPKVLVFQTNNSKLMRLGQVRSGCMLTKDVIEYDVDLLEVMTTDGLLLQMIARQDLFHPKREHQLNAKHLKEDLLEAAEGFIAQIAALGVPSLSEALETAVRAYKLEVPR